MSHFGGPNHQVVIVAEPSIYLFKIKSLCQMETYLLCIIAKAVGKCVNIYYKTVIYIVYIFTLGRGQYLGYAIF